MNKDLFLVLSELLLELAHESELLGLGLEATMAILGGGIDELEGDLLLGLSAGINDARLTESKDTLLHTNSGTLEHDKVFLNLTIVGETTKRGDWLVSSVSVATGVVGDEVALFVLVETLSDAVHLLVHLCAVMVTVLTGTANLEGNVGRMPGTNTGDLAETLVSLAGKLLDTPSVGNTLETMTLGGTKNVKVLILREDRVNWDRGGEEGSGELKLVSDGTTVHLDFHDVCLLLAKTNLLDLSVGENADNLAVLGHAGDLGIELLLSLSGVTLGEVLGESFLLGGSVVLVEAAEDRLRKLRLENSGELTETTWGLGVTDNTENNNWWGLDDGDSLDDFFLVGLGTSTVHFTNDVCHTSLVSHEGGKMRLLSLVVLREATNATAMMLGALLGEEPKGTVAWGAELTVGHGD